MWSMSWGDRGSCRVAPEPPVIRGCGKLRGLAVSSRTRWPRPEIHRSGLDSQFDRVSPGLIPRPSLCAETKPDGEGSEEEFRRGSYPGLRCAGFCPHGKMALCLGFRRGSYPGLRCALIPDPVTGEVRAV